MRGLFGLGYSRANEEAQPTAVRLLPSLSMCYDVTSSFGTQFFPRKQWPHCNNHVTRELPGLLAQSQEMAGDFVDGAWGRWSLQGGM